MKYNYNHDMTFCDNAKDCPFKKKCRRNPENTEFDENELVSYAKFERKRLECSRFWEI